MSQWVFFVQNAVSMWKSLWFDFDKADDNLWLLGYGC